MRWSPVNSFLFSKSPSRPFAHPLTFALHFDKLDFEKREIVQMVLSVDRPPRGKGIYTINIETGP